MREDGVEDSSLEIKKMTIIDLILMDFGLVKRSALKVLKDEKKDNGEEFLSLVRKCIHARDITIIETLKKYSLMSAAFKEDEIEKKVLLGEVDRLSFYLSEERLNRGEQKKSLKKVAKNVLSYIHKNELLLNGLSNTLTKEMLDEMGTVFLSNRNFTSIDFFPEDEISWKDDTQKISTRILASNRNLWH